MFHLHDTRRDFIDVIGQFQSADLAFDEPISIPRTVLRDLRHQQQPHSDEDSDQDDDNHHPYHHPYHHQDPAISSAIEADIHYGEVQVDRVWREHGLDHIRIDSPAPILPARSAEEQPSSETGDSMDDNDVDLIATSL